MKILISHIEECYKFIPAKRLWEILCSDEAENLVLLAIIAVCLYTIIDSSNYFLRKILK